MLGCLDNCCKCIFIAKLVFVVEMYHRMGLRYFVWAICYIQLFYHCQLMHSYVSTFLFYVKYMYASRSHSVHSEEISFKTTTIPDRDYID